jgi:hypothetical protein
LVGAGLGVAPGGGVGPGRGAGIGIGSGVGGRVLSGAGVEGGIGVGVNVEVETGVGVSTAGWTQPITSKMLRRIPNNSLLSITSPLGSHGHQPLLITFYTIVKYSSLTGTLYQ